MTKFLAAVAGVLFVLVLICGMLTTPSHFPEGNSDPNAPLETAKLPLAMGRKAEACHEKGMGTGRLIKGGTVTDIKCYER